MKGIYAVHAWYCAWVRKEVFRACLDALRTGRRFCNVQTREEY